MKRRSVVLALALALWAGTPALFGQEPSREDLDRKIRRLEEQLEAQKAALEELKAQAAASVDESKKLMLETAQKEIAKEAKKNNLAGFRFGGDVRARYEGTYYEDATPDRNRFRYRLRLNGQKNLGGGVTGFFQLASGSTKLVAGADLGGEATSTNQTFGDSFDRKGVWIDQAYLTWTPDIPGHGFTLAGGKFRNPFNLTQGINLVWDSDVNPEGFYQQFNFGKGGIRPFFNVGQMVIRENAADSDACMFAWQGGVNGRIEKVSLCGAVSYYHYVRYAGSFKYSNGNTVVKVGGKDVLAAADFDVLTFTGKVGFPVNGVPVEGSFEYAKNRGNRLTTGVDANQDQAWSLGVMVGKNKVQRDWSLYGTCRHIEANSLVGAFADSDFGFTNRKGLALMAKYNIYDNLTFGANFYHTRAVTGASPDFNRLQIDLEFKF